MVYRLVNIEIKFLIASLDVTSSKCMYCTAPLLLSSAEQHCFKFGVPCRTCCIDDNTLQTMMRKRCTVKVAFIFLVAYCDSISFLASIINLLIHTSI